MTFKVIGQGTSQSGSDAVKALALRPDFRRATEAMTMAYDSCIQALSPLQSFLSEKDRDDLALYVGSVYGELDATKDFLSEYYNSQIVRPILFQNSLHNAILGFLS